MNVGQVGRVDSDIADYLREVEGFDVVLGLKYPLDLMSARAVQ